MTVRRILFYLLYFLAAAAFFAVILFPHEQAGKAVTSRFNTIFKQVSLGRTNGTHLKFPAGVTLDSAAVSFFNTLQVPLQQLNVRIPLFSIIKSNKRIAFKADLLPGGLEGDIKGLNLDANRFEDLSLDVSGARVNQFAFQSALGTINASFDTDIRMVYSQPDDMLRATGTLANALLELASNAQSRNPRSPKPLPRKPLSERAAPGQVPPAPPSSDSQSPASQLKEAPTMRFDRVDLEFTIQKGVLNMTRCIAKGPDAAVDLTGEIFLDNRRAITLKGVIRPGPGFVARLSRMTSVKSAFQKNRQNGIPITISGPIANPNIRLN